MSGWKVPVRVRLCGGRARAFTFAGVCGQEVRKEAGDLKVAMGPMDTAWGGSLRTVHT